MFCIVAFVVLSILGIFSASNRTMAKEAMDCVFRRVTLRPCNTGFDEKMKAKILGVVITRSGGTARFLNKNFELLAWVFFVLTLVSAAWTVRGFYLFYTTGSCNGLNQAAFCVFDPSGANNQVSAVNTTCQVHPTTVKDLTLKGVDQGSFPVLNPTAKDKIVFVGCYSCDYTRKTYPILRKLVDKFGPSFTFLVYPLPNHESSDFSAKVSYCTYLADPVKYWQLNDILFTTDKPNVESPDFMTKTFTSLGLDTPKINACIADPKTEDAVQNQLTQINNTKFYGTPTIFVNDHALVGPKPYRVYAILLKGLFYWLK
jgi:protein-disulfide isomerase